MQTFDKIILHNSASSFGCVREIRRWHMERGWRDIGYHFVILNGRIIKNFNISSMDGSIEAGRYLDEDLMVEPNEVGAHALGYNDRSIGICMIGMNHFTYLQRTSLIWLLANLTKHFNLTPIDVLGHYETESGKAQGKTCPNFDMVRLREALKCSKRLWTG